MTVTISGLGRRFQLAGVVLVLAALALAFFARPASAAVTGTATPATGLGQTGTVAISASGFGTDLNSVSVLECQRGATDSILCDANTIDSNISAKADGSYSNPSYTYHALPDPALGVSNITCDSANPCDLLVIQDDYNNFSNPHVFIPLTFDFTVPSTTEPPTTVVTAPTSTTTTPASVTTAPVGVTTVPGATTTTVSGSKGGTTTTTLHAAGSTDPSGGTLPSDTGSASGGDSGGQLPFTGPPTAAPIVALCGIVILFAGTLMRRVVLRVPDAGASLS